MHDGNIKKSTLKHSLLAAIDRSPVRALATAKPAVLAEYEAKTQAGINPDPFLQRKAKPDTGSN